LEDEAGLELVDGVSTNYASKKRARVFILCARCNSHVIYVLALRYIGLFCVLTIAKRRSTRDLREKQRSSPLPPWRDLTYERKSQAGAFFTAPV